MALIGRQEPRLFSIPDGDTARGDEIVAFAKYYNAGLYPWQNELLSDMCKDTTTIVDDVEVVLPAAREVVVPLARQNGKGEVLIWRELAGVYLWGEKTILHSAHLMDTAQDAMRRLWAVVEANPDLMYWWEDEFDSLPQMIESNGKEAIRFPNGAIIYFRTRTIKTGRGLTVDLLIFDECFNLPLEVFAAMNATTRAVERAQKIFISSPVNRLRHVHGRVFSGKRWQGIDGAKGVLYKEWSPEPGSDPHVLETWKSANPSLVTRGPGVQLVELELESAAAKNDEDLLEVFLVEAMGKGDWFPRAGEVEKREPIFDLEVLASRIVESPPKVGDCCLAADSPPGGDSVAVWSAFRTSYGTHLTRAPITEMDRHDVAGLILRNVKSADPVAVVYDPKTAVDSITPLLEKGGIEPTRTSLGPLVTAAEMIISGLADGTVTFDGSEELIEAIKAADWRDVGEAGRAFARRAGAIHDLVAASLALWGLETFEIPDIVPAELEKHVPVAIGGAVLDDDIVDSFDEESIYV